MPSKNIRKIIATNSYYHVYNRAVDKRSIFEEPRDAQYFLNLFDRYLNPYTEQTDADGLPYANLYEHIEMQNFCIMNNHFHFLFWISGEPSALSGLMQSTCTSYTKYFNSKFDRVGPLFQSRYKASLITDDEHLLHVSRYIHRNPINYLDYTFSSVRCFTGFEKFPWLNNHRLTEVIGNMDYRKFLALAEPDQCLI